MNSLSFRKIEIKNLNSDPRILISLYWKLYHQLHIGYLNIRSDHETEAAIHALHRLLLKTFAKLAEDFIFLCRKQPFREENMKEKLTLI